MRTSDLRDSIRQIQRSQPYPDWFDPFYFSIEELPLEPGAQSANPYTFHRHNLHVNESILDFILCDGASPSKVWYLRTERGWLAALSGELRVLRDDLDFLRYLEKEYVR